MSSAKKKDMEHGQEHGAIQNLGSPILSKIQQAFLYIRTFSSGAAHDEFSSYRSVEGDYSSAQGVAFVFASSAAYFCCREPMWRCACCLGQG